MRRFYYSLIILTLLFLSGCSYTDYLKPNYISKVEFNNKYVDYIDKTSQLAADSFQKYEEIIPIEIVSNQQIDVSVLDDRAELMSEHLFLKEELSQFISLDKAQNKKIKQQFDLYFEEFNEFIALYKDVNLFYSAKEYQIDKKLVKEYNDKLAMKYETFLAAHEKFAKVLEEFVE